ncbi:MAG TPA: hypothetical protein VFS54_09760 [Solirubrobacterales bacterium]|nr:hypothetical protein [Solirubrobacterales bacterium]
MAAAVGLVACVLALLASPAAAATWTIQTTPNAAGAEHSNLYDISCATTATKPCVSVGKLTESGGKTAPYAQAWNGTSWANITAKSPEGATAGEFQSVDCLTSSELLLCFAAGSYVSGGVTKSLIVSGLNTFGLLAIQETPNPEGASETALKGMSCRVAVPGCMAVGYSVKAGKKTAFAVGRNSESKWVIQSIPEPEGATSSELHGVDCPTTTFCVAVGSYTVSGGSIWAWSATWNGTSWTLRTVPKPEGSIRTVLLDVSCSSASACAGVGIYRDSGGLQTSFVQRWNGTAWSHQASPNPEKSTNTVFQGVSCTTGPCVAVGDWNNGKNWLPMAQEYNGSAWVLDTTPNPEGATETILEGVACRATGCLSSGWYKDSGGKYKTLGETR